MTDLDALRQRLLDLPVSHLTHHAIDTTIMPLLTEVVESQVAAATESARLREAWLRERFEDEYSGALGAHTGSGVGALPPITTASSIRAILDTDLSDAAALIHDISEPLPGLHPNLVRSLVADALDQYDWARRSPFDDGPCRHTDHRPGYDGRCQVCRGDGRAMGHAVAFAYAEVAEAINPHVASLLPQMSLSRLASLVAEVVVEHEWAPDDVAQDRHLSARHVLHSYDGRCAVCRADPQRIADAVTSSYATLTGQVEDESPGVATDPPTDPQQA